MAEPASSLAFGNLDITSAPSHWRSQPQMSEWAPTTDLRQPGNPMSSSQVFHESNLFGSPIRDLGLTIDGTRLAPVIEEFRAELAQRGITEVVPRFICRPSGACRSAPSSSGFRSISRVPS